MKKKKKDVDYDDYDNSGFNVPDNMSFIPLPGVVKEGPHSSKRLKLTRQQVENERGDQEREAAKHLAMLSGAGSFSQSSGSASKAHSKKRAVSVLGPGYVGGSRKPMN